MGLSPRNRRRRDRTEALLGCGRRSAFRRPIVLETLESRTLLASGSVFHAAPSLPLVSAVNVPQPEIARVSPTVLAETPHVGGEDDSRISDPATKPVLPTAARLVRDNPLPDHPIQREHGPCRDDSRAARRSPAVVVATERGGY